MSKVFHYDGEDFLNESVSSEGVTLVDFFATWCGPCKMLGPVLDELSEEVDYKIVKVDVDKFNSLAASYGVRSIPTMVVFKDNKPLDTLIGFHSKTELKNAVDNITK